MALLVSDVPATAAAVFTTNKVVGAPIIVGRKHIQSGVLRACVINAGCANVCTGDRGVRNAMEMCALAAAGIGADPDEVLPSSTGVIGHFLPMEKVRMGISHATMALSNSAEAGTAFANGILTTDLVAKTAFATVKVGGKTVTIAGCCKGSGMIAPNMALPQATMLAYVATDAAIDKRALRKVIAEVTGQTFNCVTVDQHTSTSDTFVVLANGMAENKKIVGGSDLKKFAAALYEVCDSLSQQIARDGEGATKLITVTVTGAATAADAKKAAEAIANSPLCKTAVHGGDPNWGRFVSAAGYSGAKMNPDKGLCKVGDVLVFKNGQPTKVELAAVGEVMQGKEVSILVDLGVMAGKAGYSHRVYTCDLSREYIAINADYHT